MTTERKRVLLVSLEVVVLLLAVFLGTSVPVQVGALALGLGGCGALSSEGAYRWYVRRNQLEGQLGGIRAGVRQLTWLPFGVALAILGTKAGGIWTVAALGVAGLVIVEGFIRGDV